MGAVFFALFNHGTYIGLFLSLKHSILYLRVKWIYRDYIHSKNVRQFFASSDIIFTK